MATLPGKTDRYRPNDPTWQPASYYGGFMPGVVADQVVPQSPYYSSPVVDKTFAALGPLEPQGRTSVASIRPNWTVPTWNAPNRMDLAAIDAAKSNLPGPSLDSLLTYAKSLSDKTVVNPAVAAATAAGNPVNNVTAAIKPQSRGGLFELLFGPSKNGMGGLAGLLGGQPAPKTGPSGVGRSGYTYANGQNMGYSAEEQAKREARGKAIGEANRKNPSPTRNVFGDNNAFQPSSVQNSVRFQTGY